MIHFIKSVILLLLCLALPAWGGDSKGKNMALSFHLETDNAANPKMAFPQDIAGKKLFFQRAADITTKDVVAMGPFLADNQVDYGVVLKLKKAAAGRLENLTTANQGRHLLAKFNGRVVDVVLIDQPVKDGYIVIWNGITDAEIKECDKHLPRIAKEQKKK